MSADDLTPMEAVIALHGASDRQGPGDDQMTLDLLHRLQDLPVTPRVADLGCGTGASALVLADALKVPIECVDAVPEFIAILDERAKARRLSRFIHGHVGDMATYRHPDGPLDLLWAEGAAYNLTFAGALTAWRPILKIGGIAVISELTWFKADRPANVEAFWAHAYPHLADEAANVATAGWCGFEVVFTERLPSDAWRYGYYAPLKARARELSQTASDNLRSAIKEMEREIVLFEESGDSFGYIFYALKAV